MVLCGFVPLHLLWLSHRNNRPCLPQRGRLGRTVGEIKDGQRRKGSIRSHPKHGSEVGFYTRNGRFVLMSTQAPLAFLVKNLLRSGGAERMACEGGAVKAPILAQYQFICGTLPFTLASKLTRLVAFHWRSF